MDNPQPTAGLSPTADALRRLRKNPVAMLSLGVLVGVVLLAFFTPLLPLEPPDRDQTKRQYEPPQWTPLFEESLQLDVQEIELVDSRIPGAREALADSRRKLAGAVAATESPALVARLERGLRQSRAAIEALQQRPYSSAGFPELGPLARWMVRTRYALCGEWSLGSVCGRDKLGRDLLSRVCWGARVSLIVGFVATLVSLVIGVTYGAVSGYAGGWIDNVMMRVVDVLYSVPFIFVVIFLISILGEDKIKDRLEEYGIDRITIFYFVVGAIYWLTMARVVRGQVVSLRNEQFVEAARSIGVSQAGIVFKHIVPNLFSVVIVYLTLTIPKVVLFEAFLSFLGLGVEPPNVSWGLLANEGIQVITPLKIYWWLIVFPSIAIGLTLFALNFLGDGVRDAFDPRMKDR
ncbi:MAG: ABC transporter permease [Lacipirellulaceae bacterium]